MTPTDQPSSAPTPSWLCRTCGVETVLPLPPVCPICDDERQYVPSTGQQWAHLPELAAEGHRLTVDEVEPGLYSLQVVPKLGIGQTCYVVTTQHGNLLFDVPAFIDDDAVSTLLHLGGVHAIVASHPHMYGVQTEWSKAFANAPIYVNAADAQWVQRTSSAVEIFQQQVQVLPGVWVRRVGGHFPGSCVVWWAGRDEAGVLMGGDSITPVAREGWVTFMRSFPNYLPLSAQTVLRVADSVADLHFERIYGNFGQRTRSGGSQAVQESAQRYAAWVSGDYDHLT